MVEKYPISKMKHRKKREIYREDNREYLLDIKTVRELRETRLEDDRGVSGYSEVCILLVSESF